MEKERGAERKRKMVSDKNSERWKDGERNVNKKALG